MCVFGSWMRQRIRNQPRDKCFIPILTPSFLYARLSPPTRTYYMLHTRRLGANSPLANVLPSLRVSRAPFHVIRWMIQINSSAGILTTHASHALSLCCVVCKQHSIFTHKQYMFLWNRHTNPIPPPTPPALAPNAIMRSKCMYGLLHYNPYTRGLFQHQADCIPCGAFLFVEQYIHSRNINRTTMLMTASNRLRETKTFYIYISYVFYLHTFDNPTSSDIYISRRVRLLFNTCIIQDEHFSLCERSGCKVVCGHPPRATQRDGALPVINNILCDNRDFA